MPYDLIILGAGPAGLTASIYASRYKIPHLIIGQTSGGLASSAHKICNFPSWEKISGPELISKIEKQAKNLGGKIFLEEVTELHCHPGAKRPRTERSEVRGTEAIGSRNSFTVVTKSNKKFKSKTILLAIGTKRKKLGLKNENKFLGKGISYCATCDGFFYKDKTVAVIGSGDAANTASLMLAGVAKRVYQIFLEDEMHGETTWIEQVVANPKIKIISNNSLIGLKGTSLPASPGSSDPGLERLNKILLSKPFKANKELSVDGVFIEIGSIPDATLPKQLCLDLDKSNYIITNPDQSTNIKGIWAAGDITTGSNQFRQILTACSEAAIATESIFKFLKTLKPQS